MPRGRYTAYTKGSAVFLTNEIWIVDHVASNFAKYNGPLSVVVDIGSHIGELAVLAAKRGASRVWAVEPDRENYTALWHNIILNRVEEIVIPLHLAVWSHSNGFPLRKASRRRWLHWKHGNTGQRSLIYKKQFPATGVVPTITLTILLKWVGLPVDYLKIDIEGAEHEVLKSTKPEVLSLVSCIDLEIHDPQNLDYYNETKTTSHDLLEYLRKCGFEVPEIKEGNILCQRNRQ